MAVEGVRWTLANSRPVAHLSGEIDLTNAEALFSAVKSNGDGVIVDLTDVVFLDSAGIGQIVALAKRSSVRLVSPPGRQPRRVLKLTDMDGAIPTFDSVEAALADG
jgi:anti-anti-sigma factor